MAVAKVILNGTTLIDTTDKTVTNSNLLQSYTALGADGNTVTGSFSLGNITVNEQYLPSQTTIFNSQTKICETNSNYPGTILIMTNQSYCNFGDYLGNNIKIELNKTYHINGQFNIKWNDDNTEEYYTVNTDFKPTAYSTIGIPYTWEGSSGATQIFSSIQLEIASQGVKVRIRPTRTGTITKTGVLLSGSYYEILQPEIDGYESVTLNLIDNPQYLNIYKSLAYRGYISASAIGVSEWCNSLLTITPRQFAGQTFSGSLNFNNVSNIGQYAFAFPWNGNGGSTQNPVFEVNFLNSQLSLITNDAFISNGTLQKIYAPYVKSIDNFAFCNCMKLSSVSFPQCTFIGSAAFQFCLSLTSIYFPECISIGSYAFQSCTKLINASFPECISISGYAFSNCSSLTTASFPECTDIGYAAFYNCSKLENISFPECININSYAFQSCSSLTSIFFPKCTNISAYAFAYCTKLINASFPECISISGYTFSNCSSLITASFPKCTFISSQAFVSCSNLETIFFPECTFIDREVFKGCSKLAIASFPKCSILSYGVFSQCTLLSVASFPLCTSIGSSAFISCYSLNTVFFPICTSIWFDAFRFCSNLETASFPSCNYISNRAFSECTKLSEIYFMGSSIINMAGDAFAMTPMRYSSYLGYFGSIYVPVSLLASYKTATNWVAYSSRMVGI